VEPSEDEEILFEIEPRELAILSVFTIDPGPASWAVSRSFASGFDPKRCSRPTESPGFRDRQREYSSSPGGSCSSCLPPGSSAQSSRSPATTAFGSLAPMTNSIMNGAPPALQRDDPLDKVQTLTISESIPFRWFGYAALGVETAGYAPGQSGSRGRNLRFRSPTPTAWSRSHARSNRSARSTSSRRRVALENGMRSGIYSSWLRSSAARTRWHGTPRSFASGTSSPSSPCLLRSPPT